MGKYYKETLSIGEHLVELYLPDYRDVNPYAKSGFPILRQRWGPNPKNKNLAGFYLISHSDQIVIGISVRTKKAFDFLKLYYDGL